MTKSLLLVGVGGQGTILVSKILSEGLLEEGYDVKMAEIHLQLTRVMPTFLYPLRKSRH